MQVPPLVATLRKTAAEAGFPFSCEDSTGEILAVLSASVRTEGRILEIGTGMGVGLGWIVSGLEPRGDVAVTTIEHDAERSALVLQTPWPDWVEFVVGDVMVELPVRGTFDLIFADAEGGKWYGLDHTLSALNPGGILLLDDLVPQEWKTETERTAHLQRMAEVRQQIYSDHRLIATEIDHGTGLLVAVSARDTGRDKGRSGFGRLKSWGAAKALLQVGSTCGPLGCDDRVHGGIPQLALLARGPGLGPASQYALEVRSETLDGAA